jgi:hypothetical protein
MCITAVCAGKVRMALAFGTVVRKFKMPGSLTQENFMYETGCKENFEGAINSNLVRSVVAELYRNLVLS